MALRTERIEDVQRVFFLAKDTFEIFHSFSLLYVFLVDA
jgi:hypothetical protein